jgi:hypothetical protein
MAINGSRKACLETSRWLARPAKEKEGLDVHSAQPWMGKYDAQTLVCVAAACVVGGDEIWLAVSCEFIM